MSLIPQEKIRQMGMLLLILFLGGFLFYSLYSFIAAFCGALVLYILLRNPHFYLTEKRRFPAIVSAALLLVVSVVLFLLPFLSILFLLASKVSYVIAHYEEFSAIVTARLQVVAQYLPAGFLDQLSLSSVTAPATSLAQGFIGGTASVLSSLVVLYFILFFLLADARKFEQLIQESLPFHPENKQLLLQELKKATYSNSIGMLIMAVLQGLLAWIGYAVAGIPESFLWAVVTAVFSFVPVVGVALVWVPLCLFLWTAGYYGAAGGLAAYALLIIGNMDNVIRFYIQKKFSNTHPLITFFGVIIGVNILGMAGLVFGPLLISYFLLLVRIYRSEFSGT